MEAIVLLVILGLLSQCIRSADSCPKSLVEEASNRQTKVRLAVQPACGSLSSSEFQNFNTGICLSRSKTIYTFGDSYTSNGNSNGGDPLPAEPSGTNPNYGGRASNGKVYTEYLVPDGSTIRNYAVGGATVDRRLWLRRRNATDMRSHVDTFLGQRNYVDETSTLAIIFYGINDMGSRQQGPGTLRQAAEIWLQETERLIKVGLRQFIIISIPDDEKDSRGYCNIIWQGMKAFKSKYGISFAYIDLMDLWKPLLRKPRSFGFQNSSSCLSTSQTIVGGCSDPQDYAFWTPGHPQTLTHMLIADWIKEVLNNCGEPSSSTTTKSYTLLYPSAYSPWYFER